MEIKIGIAEIAHDVMIEATQTGEEVAARLREALKDPEGVLELSDERGRRLLVPAAKIGFVDLGQDHHRQVGFGAPQN